MPRLDHELPPLPDDLVWLDRPPIDLPRAARGQVLVVLAWRLGCLHSRLALDELARLAGRLPGRLVVVAVHVPASAAERDQSRLRRAVGDRPVLLAEDASGSFRRRFGLARLPWLVLVDAAGLVRGLGCGEPRRAAFGDAVHALVREASAVGAETRLPLLPLAAPPVRLQPQALAVAADQLWLASAGHRCLYRLSADGQVEQTVRAAPGFVAPAALAWHGDEVLVADAGAHLLRAVALATGDVRTVVGTGERSTDRTGGGYGTTQGLAAPAGLASADGGVYLTQTGVGSIWQVDPGTGHASDWLAEVDGVGVRFAEPMGLLVTDTDVLVADASAGAVFAVDRAHLRLRKVAGELTRPVALANVGEDLLVADAGRARIWRGAVHGGGLRPWLGAEHGLVEPVALAVWQQRLWIADVGADALWTVDLAAPDASPVRVALQGSSPPRPATTPRLLLADRLLALPFRDTTLRIVLPLAADESVDDGALCRVQLGDEGRGLLACEVDHAGQAIGDHVDVPVPFAGVGSGALRVRLEFAARDRRTGLAAERRADLLAPLTIGSDGAAELSLRVLAAPGTSHPAAAT